MERWRIFTAPLLEDARIVHNAVCEYKSKAAEPTSIPFLVQVYNVTEFLDEHPGGFDIILTNTGNAFPHDAKVWRSIENIVALRIVHSMESKHRTPGIVVRECSILMQCRP